MLEKTQSPSPVTTRRSFLSGPTLYLRGIELTDAATMTSWHPSRFPAPSDLAEERLKEEVPGSAHRGSHRLIACRHRDNLPMGSVEYAADDGRTCWLSLYANPLLGDEAGAVRAELLKIAVPWLMIERDLVAIWVEVPSGDEPVEQAVAKLGMRFAYRLREAVLFNGRRTDLMCYEALHPKWIDRFGAPELAVEAPVERTPKSPAPQSWKPQSGASPKNAFAIGDRLYLRPIEQSDAEEIARWSFRETEQSHDLGRHVRSPISDWVWNRRNAAANSPSWIRFSIVTLDGDIVIGSNGLADLDWINRTAETETVIARSDFRGSGYGTEAKHLMLEYAFERIGLHMVKSYVWTFNNRSYAALQNQGYRHAGGLSWTGIKDAEYVDDFVLDLLADEWREQRASSR